jgi:hypothetical protein
MAALMYPIIMVGVGAIVVSILMAKVVPRLIMLVESRGQELPLPTQILKGAASSCARTGTCCVLAIVLINMGIGALRRTENGRYAVDRFLLRLPVFGDLFKKQAISRFAITLSTLLKTGVPVLDAIKIVREVVGNAVLQGVLDDLHAAILQGADISSPLKKSGIFPPAVGYMIAVGEQTGELEAVLDRLAEAYDLEVEIATEKLTAVIEPLLILLMAIVVAFIVCPSSCRCSSSAPCERSRPHATHPQTAARCPAARTASAQPPLHAHRDHGRRGHHRPAADPHGAAVLQVPALGAHHDHAGQDAEPQAAHPAVPQHGVQAARLAGVAAGAQREEPDEPYVDSEDELNDAWGNRMQYVKQTGSKYDLISLGADGVEGGEAMTRDIHSSKTDIQASKPWTGPVEGFTLNRADDRHSRSSAWRCP